MRKKEDGTKLEDKGKPKLGNMPEHFHQPQIEEFYAIIINNAYEKQFMLNVKFREQVSNSIYSLISLTQNLQKNKWKEMSQNINNKRLKMMERG